MHAPPKLTLLPAVLATVLLAHGHAAAATITVDDPGDYNNGGNAGSDCHTNVHQDQLRGCTLREAIHASNWDHDTSRCKGTGVYGADTIVFALPQPTIRVIGAWGLPYVEGSLEIVGEGVTISGDADGDGDGDGAIFRVAETGALVLDGLTLRDASHGGCPSDVGGPALRVVEGGRASVVGVTFLHNGTASWKNYPIRPGAIVNDGTIEVWSSHFEDNGGMNAAVLNRGRMTIAKSSFVANMSVGWQAWSGGALAGEAFSVTEIEDSQFVGNWTDNWGGAIRVQLGTLRVRSSSFEKNYAGPVDPSAGIPEDYFDEGPYRGGAISAGGSSVQIVGCTFEGNSSDEGGAISTATSSMDITGSTFEDNHARVGGALSAFGPASSSQVAVRRSLFTENTATSNGGGISVSRGNLYVANTTFHSNHAARGGGVDLAAETDGAALLLHATFSHNTAESGGGLHSAIQAVLGNTIIANSVGGDCAGASLLGYVNLVEDSSCGFSGGVDPKLGVLKHNGGPTRTMALAEDSPAVDVAHDAVCSDLIEVVDQRGLGRPWGAHCDLGAFEYQPGGISL